MNQTNSFRLILVILFFGIICGMANAQVNLKKVGMYQYAQYDGIWYTIIDGRQGNRMDPKHLVVRLKDKSNIELFDFQIISIPKLKNVRGEFADGFYELEIPAGYDEFEIARKLEETEKFDEVLFNFFVDVDADPNDQYYNNQWALSKINASNAWDITVGVNSVIVAVIDVGGDYNHEDLIGNKWSGTGYDFYDNDSDPYPDDEARHGTAVAGILGAVTNNGIGVSGVAGGWGGSGGIRIMHLDAGYRWYDQINQEWKESLSSSAVAQAIDFAAVWGAQVINMSFGSLSGFTPWSSAINRAVNNYGVICVASAGNYRSGGSTNVIYPAAYSNVVAVGATTPSDTRKELNDGTESWWGSCYGPQLDVMAPGVFIYTTDLTGSIGYSSGNYYSNFNGTSAAAPFVAGLAALIRSINPSLTWQQVRDVIRNSADKVSGMGGQNFHNEYGYGRINSLSSAVNAYILSNPQYTYTENYASITLYQQNIWRDFDCFPAPGIPPGRYYIDIYKIEATTNNYANIFNGWFLGLPGYYPGTPINCQPYLYKNVENDQLTLRTFYYFIKKNIGLNPVNVWAPLDPTSNSTRKYSVLGEPVVAPIISNFTQSPIPICKGSSGYVQVNLSQGNGKLTYNWISENQPSYISIDKQGNRCYITYNYSKAGEGIDGPLWNFGCTVSNSAGQSTAYYTPALDPFCSGCPTLAFEQNGILTDENPLLITSMSNPEKDVTDYYLINTPLSPVDNRINLTIHEPQTEHTWFDNISLIEARAKPDEKIVVNEEGQLITYKEVLPARILLNDEIDITEKLLEMDSLVVNLKSGDKLTINRSPVEGDGDVVLGGELGPPGQKNRPSMIVDAVSDKQAADGEELMISENTRITDFYLRSNRSIVSKRLRNIPSGRIEITINKDLVLDYFVFVRDLKTATSRALPLVSAVHNINGDIKSKLSGIDQNYAELYPSERIDLSFSTTTKSGNRAYILKSVGRYETDTTFLGKQNNLAKLNEVPTIPTENKLYDNYPNPFNPTTQIKYSIKESGLVQIKVYDILGKEITTLVNERKDAGSYTIDFNASALPSGVYIYQLITPGFTQARKMILAK